MPLRDDEAPLPMRDHGRAGAHACRRAPHLPDHRVRMIPRLTPRMRAALVAVAALVIAASGILSPASAHQSPYSFVDLRLSNHAIEGRVAAHVVDLAHEAGLAEPDSLLDSSYLERHRAALEAVLSTRFALRVDGATVLPRWGAPALDAANRRIAFGFTLPRSRPAGAIELRGPLFPYDPLHETYLNLYEGGAIRRQEVLDAAHPELRWFSGSRQGTLEVVKKFVAEGVHHIFLGPDHILFILGLLLLGGGLPRLLKIVTAFTLAHSVTLALAALQIVNPPSRVIEPAIALSIIVVGVENLLARGGGRDVRAGIAFGFGFIHGFGFASVLREFGLPPGALGWSLFSFNLGVEIGQMLIVLSVAPALAWLHSRRPRLWGRVLTAGSACVIAAGTYWFVQRVFFA